MSKSVLTKNIFLGNDASVATMVTGEKQVSYQEAPHKHPLKLEPEVRHIDIFDAVQAD